MEVKRLPVKDFIEGSREGIIIDVRSPAEYAHAHLPGAVSIPLFNNDERKVVGTAYKQESREKAIKIGLDFFAPKMKNIVEQVEQMVCDKYGVETSSASKEIKPQNYSIHVYCWRGGMRSSAVAWLLQLYGFKVHTLAGGYKSFRNYVLQSFEATYHLQIVGGYTGSGKTEVLNELENRGQLTVDIEAIACHKGSAFGNINMPQQPSQEMFENLLAMRLTRVATKSSGPIWLEDESQRVGLVNIPGALWRQMRASFIYFLDIPFEERLNHITEEYGQYETSKLADATARITKRLGGLETKNALLFLEEGNLREAFSILLQYYDKQYLKGLHNREALPNLLHKIKCNSVTSANAQVLLQQQLVISQ